ncbi:MAG: Asp-tRNA(Asn)/Glu-tRNA(Gln) amidotransferase subunit GatA [Acidobacteriota bacterium]|nr:MAG: Asp-tRNA(Asn)/Glu-tRNA(Gln) amidotransferase subunit GatA [Acidobacteriota bacterium]
MSNTPLATLSERLQKKETTCVALAEEALARIEEVNPKLNAFITVMRDEALARARALDEELRAGKSRGPLHGVPTALKDNLCTRGVRMTCASKILENFVPPYNATSVARAEEAGAVFVGKTNMDEFAMGSSTEHSAFGAAHNPWDLERVTGGSSGGSAAAVASGCAPVALGSDTGGSIRQPAAFCGVVGMKPTYGRISRYGLVAFASSLDQIGPFARSVHDAATLLAAVAGRDPRDSTSVEVEADFLEGIDRGVKDLKVGLVEEGFGEGVAPEVRQGIERAAEILGGLGARVERLSLPSISYAIPTYYLLCTSEASSNLARYDGVRYGRRAPEAGNVEELYVRSRSEGFGPEVKRRIMLGTYALSAGYYDAYYARAQRGRRLIANDFNEKFERVRVLLLPSTPTPAFRLGENIDDPLQMYLCDIFTVSINLGGLPGLSMPCGKTSEGLPLGVQLVAPAFQEATLFRTAQALEKGISFAYEGMAV